MTEIWKEIPELGGDYYVSNFGRVISCKKNSLEEPYYMTLCPDLHGYLVVYMQKNGKRYRRFVHRLVAEAFIENPFNYPCINHRDEDKANNCVDNLEWCTYKYNSNYGTILQRLSKKRSKPIVQMKDGKIVKIWNSITEAGRNGYDRTCVGLCCVGKYRSNDGLTYRGYQWKHLSDINA